MEGWDRDRAVRRIERLVETVESEPTAVPVREIWVLGGVALGLDPVERIDVYLTKDILLHDDADREDDFVASHGIEGVGKTVRAEWADQYPEHLRATSNGHAAPEKCLAAHLLDGDEPIHLEVCNASFENNVRQRLEGALAREDYRQVLDPRGACLWMDGHRSEEAFEKLRNGDFVFPTLPESLEMLGADPDQAAEAAEAVKTYRDRQEGATVRGDVV
jgi:hypothetical protein